MSKNPYFYVNAGFGFYLLQFRQRFDVTLSKLSMDTGIPLSVLEQIELGNLNPDKNVLNLLSLYFHEDFELKWLGSEIPENPANNN